MTAELPESLARMNTHDLAAEITRLRAQVAGMARLADAVPHIVWTMSPDGAPTYFNAKWTEYSGLDLDATLRIGAGTFVHPEDLASFEAEIREAAARAVPFEIAYRLRRAADNLYCWHVARVVPLRSEDGRVASWVATATNIEEERRHEEQQKYLVAASGLLGTSLDLKQTLSDVASLLVPHMGDWCSIDLLTETGSIDRQAVAHVSEPWSTRLPTQPQRRSRSMSSRSASSNASSARSAERACSSRRSPQQSSSAWRRPTTSAGSRRSSSCAVGSRRPSRGC